MVSGDGDGDCDYGNSIRTNYVVVSTNTHWLPEERFLRQLPGGRAEAIIKLKKLFIPFYLQPFVWPPDGGKRLLAGAGELAATRLGEGKVRENEGEEKRGGK